MKPEINFISDQDLDKLEEAATSWMFPDGSKKEWVLKGFDAAVIIVGLCREIRRLRKENEKHSLDTGSKRRATRRA